MSAPRVSVLIPYRRRLDNLRNAFAALADQTINGPDLEVVVGAIEYAPEYTAVAAEFADQLDIVTVTTGGGWNVSRARNRALPAATGEVLVHLDVDMVLPPTCLETIYSGYFAAGQDVCVLGQMLGYDDDVRLNDSGDADPEPRPYAYYRKILRRMQAEGVDKPDDRVFVQPLPLAWTLVWCGLAAIRADTVRRHNLYFDERFHGWGAEDQEWGYRIQAAGLPIIMSREAWGLHLPHPRDAAANIASYRANMRHFLTTSPTLDVELMRAFGWDHANRLWAEACREASAAADGVTLGIVRFTADGADVLVVGAALDLNGQPVDPEVTARLGADRYTEVLPLLGLALPYPDATFDTCVVLPSIQKLSEKYRAPVLKEANRVARGARS